MVRLKTMAERRFCSVTAMVIPDTGSSLWVAALADPPGQEVPLPEALVRAEDVRGQGAAGAHPQGDWELPSWGPLGTSWENEPAAHLLSMTSVHIRKHSKQF